MRILLSITGTTDGYGLGELYKVLAKRFTAARRGGVGILCTPGSMPDLYRADLTDESQGDLVGGSRLTVVRLDSSADERSFAVTVVTDSRAFADQLCRDFTAPGVSDNLKNIEAREVGKTPAIATNRA